MRERVFLTKILQKLFIKRDSAAGFEDSLQGSKVKDSVVLY